VPELHNALGSVAIAALLGSVSPLLTAVLAAAALDALDAARRIERSMTTPTKDNR
jgi:hypothetical protein